MNQHMAYAAQSTWNLMFLCIIFKLLDLHSKWNANGFLIFYMYNVNLVMLSMLLLLSARFYLLNHSITPL